MCVELGWVIDSDFEYVSPKSLVTVGGKEGERTFDKGTVLSTICEGSIFLII